MSDFYYENKDKIKVCLKEIWDYMKLNQNIEKSDLIIGCGCSNLDVPIKCSKLYKEGFASKILFTGGYGKITKKIFNKPESLIYRDIAIENGVAQSDILTEIESTNTGSNFINSLQLIEKYNIKSDKIIIVHKPFNERRTLSTAKMFLKNRKLIITSPDISFDEYFENLDHRNLDEIIDDISIIVGDIQRIIIYPQFNFQIRNQVPENIINDYFYLKDLGFSKYILSKEKIDNLVKKYGPLENVNYFN